MIEHQGVDKFYWNDIIPFGPQDMDVTLSQDGGSITRSYLVPWSMPWQAVAQQFIGYSQVQPNPNHGSDGEYVLEMVRRLPQSIEYMTESNPTSFALDYSFGGYRGFMYASDLKIRPLGGVGLLTVDQVLKGFPQSYRDWKYALFVVTYKTTAYDVYTRGDIEAGAGVFPPTLRGPKDSNGRPTVIGGPIEANRFVDWQDDDQLKFAQVDKAAWVTYPDDNFASGNSQSVGNKIGLPFAEGKVTMTWYDVDPVAFDAQQARKMNGTYNLYQFFDYPQKTLIFSGFRRRRRRGPLGNRLLNIEFTFIERPNGANSFLRNNGTWATVFLNGDTSGTYHPIRGSNFNQLFESTATVDTYTGAGGDF